MEQKTNLTFSQPEERDALLSWWKELDKVRGERTALRQCHTPPEVAFTPAFYRLKMRLDLFGSVSPDHLEKLAIIAGVLSHVKEYRYKGYERNFERSFAVQMARPPLKWGREKRACISDLRFRQLLKIDDPDKLYTTMIRFVRLLGGSVDIASLANGIYWWNEHTKKEWAYAYYENAPREENSGV
jgi:CRISPR system Cascade subunit CasB